MKTTKKTPRPYSETPIGETFTNSLGTFKVLEILEDAGIPSRKGVRCLKIGTSETRVFWD